MNNFQEHVFEELGTIKARLGHLEKGVDAMRKNFPKWAITGGFLAGIVVSMGHHLMGCSKETPIRTVVSDSSKCVLEEYVNSIRACGGNLDCANSDLSYIAKECRLEEDSARQLVSAYNTALNNFNIEKDSGQ